MLSLLYRRLLRPLLYLLSAETAHKLIVGLLRLVQLLPFGLWLTRRAFPRPQDTRVQAWGLDFPSPVGLAAGFDKDAEVFRALDAVGFGFVEVGTVTAEGQSGNPLPRLFRLPRDRALINRMGFNNRGAAHAAARLQSTPRDGLVLGINIGKTKLVAPEDAVADYQKSARLLGPLADYLVVNVSSPNTPGLRDLQAVSALRPILQGVRSTLDESVPGRRVPLLVKIAPDLSDEDILSVADLALELGLDGIIATNTTISRSGLASSSAEVASAGAGGLSGAPLKERALTVLRLLRARVGSELVLVSAGGIDSADEAWERVRAGATLVQLYTALIYEGPSLPTDIAYGLSERRRDAGLTMQEAIGSGLAS